MTALRAIGDIGGTYRPIPLSQNEERAATSPCCKHGIRVMRVTGSMCQPADPRWGLIARFPAPFMTWDPVSSLVKFSGLSNIDHRHRNSEAYVNSITGAPPGRRLSVTESVLLPPDPRRA